MRDLTPGTALFVGGFVAVLFLFAAALVYAAAPGVRAVTGLALSLAAVGAVFALAGFAVAGLLYLASE